MWLQRALWVLEQSCTQTLDFCCMELLPAPSPAWNHGFMAARMALLWASQLLSQAPALWSGQRQLHLQYVGLPRSRLWLYSRHSGFVTCQAEWLQSETRTHATSPWAFWEPGRFCCTQKLILDWGNNYFSLIFFPPPYFYWQESLNTNLYFECPIQSPLLEPVLLLLDYARYFGFFFLAIGTA